MVAKAAVPRGSGTNCIAGVGVGHAEERGRLFSVCATAVATALLIAAIWLVVKFTAEFDEDGSAIWSGFAFLSG